MNTLSKIILAALLACAGNLASAQQITRVPLPDDLTILLGQAAVQEELQLSNAQRAAATQLSEKVSKERKDLRDLKLPREDMLKTAAELKDQHINALKDILWPKQFERLNEVSLQYRMSIDWFATLTRTLSEKLSLTENQKTKLTELRKDQMAAHANKMRGTQLFDLDKKSRAVRADETNEALQILTEGQKQIFDELRGKEFDVSKIDDYAKPTKK